MRTICLSIVDVAIHFDARNSCKIPSTQSIAIERCMIRTNRNRMELFRMAFRASAGNPARGLSSLEL